MRYLNNPLNIRDNRGNKWLGQVGAENGFCLFSNIDYGIRAALIILCRSYRAKRVVTLRDIVSRWAPPEENDTEAYVRFLLAHGCNNGKISTRMQYARLVVAMAKIESRTEITLSDVYKVWFIHKIKIANPDL